MGSRQGRVPWLYAEALRFFLNTDVDYPAKGDDITETAQDKRHHIHLLRIHHKSGARSHHRVVHAVSLAEPPRG